MFGAVDKVKKDIGVIRKGLLVAFLCGVGVFFCSCGLDETYELAEPTVRLNYSTYDTSDPLSWYCEFETAKQDSDLKEYLNYLGTGVYYKIYNNYSTLVSQRSSITSLNTSSNGSSAATRMIQTLGFQSLGTNPNLSWAVFVKEDFDSSSYVKFRLKSRPSADYSSGSMTAGSLAMIAKRAGDADDYAYVGYSGGEQSYTYTASSGTWSADFDTIRFVVPFRYDNSHSFDFFDDDDDDDDGNRDIEPENGDSDYYYSSSASAEDTYYVQLFAVSIARSGTYEMSYSLVLDLGAIPIIKGQ